MVKRLNGGVFFFLFWAISSWVFPSQEKLPLVKLVATGGTIAHLPDGSYISGAQLVADVPEIARYARVEVIDFSRTGSASITVEMWLRLAQVINGVLENEEEVDGIVITHGSNSLAETAYFLNLTVRSSKPVVVTAAQRRHRSLSSEGPRNLLSAVRAAIDPAATGKGVLVVANDEIHAAREVTKTISYRVETYNSRDLGSLGYVDDQGVAFYRQSTRRHTLDSEFDVSPLEALPRVDIVYSAVGTDSALVDAALKAGARGLVVAGFPTGSPAPGMRPGLLRASKKGLPLLVTNRGGTGRIRELRVSGEYTLLGADNLSPQKARILLMLALVGEKSTSELRRIFREY